MSKIDRFLAKPMEFVLAGEKEFLKPLTVADMPILVKLDSRDDNIKAKALSQLIEIYMKQIDPEATNEQVKNVSIEYLEDIMHAISKVNNMDIDDTKKKFLDKVKEKQKGAK